MWENEMKIKVCSCCLREYTRSQWEELQWVGETKINDGEEPSVLEWRNCKCKSTITVGYNQEGERVV